MERHTYATSETGDAPAADLALSSDPDPERAMVVQLRRLLADALVRDYLAERQGVALSDGDGTAGDAIPFGRVKRGR